MRIRDDLAEGRVEGGLPTGEDDPVIATLHEIINLRLGLLQGERGLALRVGAEAALLITQTSHLDVT